MRDPAARRAGSPRKKTRSRASQREVPAIDEASRTAPVPTASEILTAVEHMREAIGQQLHDDTASLLAGLSCLTQSLATRAGSLSARELIAELNEVGQQLKDAGQRVRTFAHHLVSSAATHRGLRGALNQLVAQAVLLYGVKIKLRLPSALLRHQGNHVVQLHGIAHESIANAITHGHATSLRIHLRAHGKNHALEIRDNGRGWSGRRVRDRGIGLHLMKQRAQLLGATLTVTNAAPRGVCVRVNYSVA